MKRNITCRPGKAGGILGLVVGVLFVILGVAVVIPAAGLFGVIWTLAALCIAVANGVQAFGKRYVGPRIEIEDEEPERPAAPAEPELNAQARLSQLENLKSSGLITGEEYRAKREEILRRL